MQEWLYLSLECQLAVEATEKLSLGRRKNVMVTEQLLAQVQSLPDCVSICLSVCLSA